MNINNKESIIITGDNHGSIEKFIGLNHILGKDANKYVTIVCGDWGLVYYPERVPYFYQQMQFKQMLAEMNDMIYFVVLGNHENYDILNSYPEKEAFGNKVLCDPNFPNIVYAKRGEIYTICGKNFWCFGGGYSIDVNMRQPNLSWWEQELPTKEEKEYGLKNLKDNIDKIDYIVTHTCPQNFIIETKIITMTKINRELEEFLQEVFDISWDKIKKWYCGHFHIDKKSMCNKIHFLYNSFAEIGD